MAASSGSSLKECSVCKSFVARSNFQKDSRLKDGLRSECKNCSKERDRKKYLRYREKRLLQQKEYYQEHREEAIQYARQWRKDNPDKTREYHRTYAEKYSDKERFRQLEKSRRYIEEQPDRVKQWGKNWRSRNKHKVAAKAHRRRSNSSEFVVLEKDLKKIYASSCSHCGSKERITLDHVVPISRGGKHSVGNFQPLCFSCNSSKGNKLMIEWILYKKSLNSV